MLPLMLPVKLYPKCFQQVYKCDKCTFLVLHDVSFLYVVKHAYRQIEEKKQCSLKAQKAQKWQNYCIFPTYVLLKL